MMRSTLYIGDQVEGLEGGAEGQRRQYSGHKTQIPAKSSLLYSFFTVFLLGRRHREKRVRQRGVRRRKIRRVVVVVVDVVVNGAVV